MMKIFKTALVGLGAIGMKNSEDNVMSKTVKFSSHIQSIKAHDGYELFAAIDSNEERLEEVWKKWHIENLSRSPNECKNKDEIEILIIATPPAYRLDIIREFPNLRALIIEKPIAESLSEALEIEKYCLKNNIKVQVNLSRRADKKMIKLKDSFHSEIGDIQTVNVIYGNGLLNNGTHMIDLVRMLIDEINLAHACHKPQFKQGPITNDKNISFYLLTNKNILINFNAINFENFRENSIDIWGAKGRIEILNEGLIIRKSFTKECRSLANAKEIEFEGSTIETTDYSNSLFNLYDNLFESLTKEVPLVSPISSAIINERIIDQILKSYLNLDFK